MVSSAKLERLFGGNRELTIARDGYSCVRCSMSRSEHVTKYKVDITVDHINHDRDNNNLSNLQTLCLSCHGKKDWIERRYTGMPYSVRGPNTHCKRGHEYNDVNTRYYRKLRICRLCVRLRQGKKR